MFLFDRAAGTADDTGTAVFLSNEIRRGPPFKVKLKSRKGTRPAVYRGISFPLFFTDISRAVARNRNFFQTLPGRGVEEEGGNALYGRQVKLFEKVRLCSFLLTGPRYPPGRVRLLNKHSRTSGAAVRLHVYTRVCMYVLLKVTKAKKHRVRVIDDREA